MALEQSGGDSEEGQWSSLALEITSERQLHAIEPHPAIYSACLSLKRVTTPFRRRVLCSLAERGYQLCDLAATPSFFEPN